jgi:hypothetical protein
MLWCISSAQIALCVLCSLAGGEGSVFGMWVLLAVVAALTQDLYYMMCRFRA